MTCTQLLIACGLISVLLIGWLMIYLAASFHGLWLSTCSNEDHRAYMLEQEREARYSAYQSYLEADDEYGWQPNPDYQPKRRKYRDKL